VTESLLVDSSEEEFPDDEILKMLRQRSRELKSQLRYFSERKQINSIGAHTKGQTKGNDHQNYNNIVLFHQKKKSCLLCGMHDGPKPLLDCHHVFCHCLALIGKINISSYSSYFLQNLQNIIIQQTSWFFRNVCCPNC